MEDTTVIPEITKRKFMKEVNLLRLNSCKESLIAQKSLLKGNSIETQVIRLMLNRSIIRINNTITKLS